MNFAFAYVTFFWSYGVGKTKWYANKCTVNWNGVFCLEMFSGEILLRNMIFAYHWHQEIQQNLKRSKKCLRTQRQDNSQMSNIVIMNNDRLNSNVGFRFWFNPLEYFHQKGFIPLSRVPSFFEKWQVVIKLLYLENKDNFKLIFI